MPSNQFSMESFDGRRLWCDLDLPADPQGPLVVMAHGFMGFKDWGFFPYVASAFAASGFPVLRFNFSGSGMKEATDGLFTDLQGFQEDTITRQVEDLHAVVDAAKKGRVPGLGPCDRVMLWGHSRGGGVALLSAVGDVTVKAVAAWAPISRVARYKMEVTEDWRRKGYRAFKNGRTGQELRSSVAFLEDLEKWRGLGDIPSEAFRLKVPILLVHGQEDVSVKPEESESLARILPTARLAVVSGADHSFSSQHPFDQPSEALDKALKITQEFLKEVSK